MNGTEILIHIVGGVCLLLWGVGMVSAGLNRAFGTQLRRFISNSTSNRVKAFFSGLTVAAVLQSSTATSLIVSSFAARRVITVASAIALMLGADVGTTLAVQFMSLNLRWLPPVVLILGFAVTKMMSDSPYKHVGRALIGIGLALLALRLITGAAEPLKNSDVFHALIGPLREQPALAMMLAGLFTWLVHSTLGMVLLYTGFAASGTMPVDLALYMVLGANVGGAMAPVLMTLRDIPAGRRVPLGNLTLRALGVLLALPLMPGLILPFVESLHADPGRMVVNFHTLFNLGLALTFLPFVGPMTRVSEILLPDRAAEEDDSLPRYLDPDAIATPPAALACVARETLRISDIIQKMLQDTLEVFRTNDSRLMQSVRDREKSVDGIYDAIKNYLARLSGQTLHPADARRYAQIMTFSTNLEHIGDIIDKSLMDLAAKKIRNHDNFSRQGFADIAALHAGVIQSFQLAQNVFMTADVDMARKLFEQKSLLRGQEMRAAEAHFHRLRQGIAETIATSSVHLDVLRDLRRINSYVSLIAYPVLENANAINPTRLKPRRAPRKKPAVAKKKPSTPPLPEKY